MFTDLAVSPLQMLQQSALWIDGQVTFRTFYDIDVISDVFFQKSLSDETFTTITAREFVNLYLSFKMIFESRTTRK